MLNGNDTHVTSMKDIVALGSLGIVGNISPYILPLIVGALVDHVGFSIEQAGLVASADMFGLGAGTLVWSRFIMKGDWRKFALASAILLCVGNILCAFTDTFIAVALSRFVAGIGAGLMLTIGVSGLATTNNPDRIVAIYAMIVTAFASVVLYVFPFLLVRHGSSGMFLAMASFACLAGISSFFVPQTLSGAAKLALPSRALVKKPALFRALFPLSLAGVLVSFFGMSLFWVFIERAGVTAGFVTSQIAGGLGSAQAAGIFGALTAAIVSTRFGNRLLPVMFTLALALIASVAIPTTTGFVLYVLSAGSLIFSWNMLYPYVVGILISLDSSARLVTYGLVVMTLGKSLSPLVGAYVVSETDYSSAYWLCIICFGMAALLFLPALRITDRNLK